MAFVTADRTADTTTTVGTSPLVVSGTAPVGSQTFSAVMSVGDTCYYSAQHRTLNEWEVGLATYSSADTLDRTTIYSSSNAGSAVNFSAGTKDVFITMAASRSVQINGSGQTINSGGIYTRTTITATAGQTSFTASYTVNYVQVYVNGILLNSADYTATTGTTVVLASAAAVGDIVDVIALNMGSFTSGGYTRTTYTGTAGQTTFTASYTPGFIQVYLNGVLLDTSDYTASSGSAVVLNTGTAAGDTVDLIALNISGFTGSVTISGAPTSGQIAAWTGSSSIQGIAAPTTAGNVVFTTDGTNWSSTQKIARATVQTPTSGVSVGFTSIPSWVKRITMLLNGISTTGTSDIAVRIGSGSYVTSGYVGSSAFVSQSSVAAGGAALTTAFTVSGIIAAGTSSGVITLYNITGNVWSYAATMTRNGGTTAQNGVQTTVYIPLTLSGVLDQVQLLSSNGTDTFDAGSVNILYE